MSRPLDYMPQSYRRDRPVWPMLAGISFVLFVIDLAVRLGQGTWLFPVHCILAVFTLLFAGAAVLCWWGGWGCECCIEGDVLSFRTIFNRQTRVVQIDSIEQVVVVTRSEECWYELVVKDHGRIRVDPCVLNANVIIGKAIKLNARVKAALLAVNPAIRFLTRDGKLCHACGARVDGGSWTDRCPNCGAMLPVSGKYV